MHLGCVGAAQWVTLGRAGCSHLMCANVHKHQEHADTQNPERSIYMYI